MKRTVLIACLIVVIIGGGYGAHACYIHTHCTPILGREVCGADRSMPMLPAF